MAADQAPPSLRFSRQEHWSGLPFPLQCMKVKSESEVAQSCLTPSYPMNSSLPSSSIHGIFQARVLEWGAIAFSESLVEYVQMVNVWVFPATSFPSLISAIPPAPGPHSDPSHQENMRTREAVCIIVTLLPAEKSLQKLKRKILGWVGMSLFGG